VDRYGGRGEFAEDVSVVACAGSPGVHPRSDPRPMSEDCQRGAWSAVRLKPDLPTISWLE
jgi:hypothetical protein